MSAYIDDWFYKTPPKGLLESLITRLSISFNHVLNDKDLVMEVTLDRSVMRNQKGTSEPEVIPTLLLSAGRDWHTDFDAHSVLYVIQRADHTVEAVDKIPTNQDAGSIIVLDIENLHRLRPAKKRSTSYRNLWAAFAFDYDVLSKNPLYDDNEQIMRGSIQRQIDELIPIVMN